MRIYLDLVVLLNFLVDLLLLLGTNRLSGFPSDWRRLLLASTLGGCYAGACLIPGFRFLGNSLWRLVSLGCMACLAFGWSRSMVKRCGMFMLLSMALGGIAMNVSRPGFSGVLLCGGGMWILCKMAFRDHLSGCIPLIITHQGRRVELTALRDTGNTLRDPVSGEQVLVISPDAAEHLTGLTHAQLCAPLETLAGGTVKGLRLIPYHAVGNAGGLMLAMRFEDVWLGSGRRSALVAFATEGLGREGMVQALTGGVV